MISFYLWREFQFLDELEPQVYNKCFELYSILNGGWRKILELLGEEGLFWYFLIFGIDPHGSDIYVTKDN